MWPRLGLPLLCLQLVVLGAAALRPPSDIQKPLGNDQPVTATGISSSFFGALERLSRLVDIAYCIGAAGTGITKPFECVSRCSEFPTLSLTTTWNTGILLSDSCGYIAVDHGIRPLSHVDDGLDHSAGTRAIIVAFRGTYSITNTVIDLSTVPQKYVPYPSPDHGGEKPPQNPAHECKNCTVHMGFLDSWKNARLLVLPHLVELKSRYPAYPIRIVGHSLGGSVACLAALELRVTFGWDDVTVTTFGEPRVGNYELARFVDEVFNLDGDENLEKRSYRRVTHYNDPVPLLPPSEWGYRSHGGEVFITKEELSPSEADIHTCVGDDDPACSAGAESTMRKTMHRFFHFKKASETLSSFMRARSFPTRFKLWQLFFAHRDYFWRLGLCVPGGDPVDWGREKYGFSDTEEL